MILAQVTTNVVTITNTVSDVTGAFTTLVHAALPHLTAQEDIDIVGLIFLIARLLRKAIPDELQTGKAGELLKHIALEVNPVLGELKPIVKEVEPIVAGLVQEHLNQTQPITGQIATPVVSQPPPPMK
jgi:hypothetical protein